MGDPMNSSDNRWTRSERIALAALMVAVAGTVAAWLAVPAFRQSSRQGSAGAEAPKEQSVSPTRKGSSPAKAAASVDPTSEVLPHPERPEPSRRPTLTLTPVEGSGLPNDITVSIQRCARSGEYIECWGYVTNLSGARQRFHFGSAKPVDDLGNAIPMGYFGKKGASRPNFSGEVHADLVPSIPTKYEVTVWDPHPAVKKFSSLVFDEVIWENKRYTVTLTDVPVQG